MLVSMKGADPERPRITFKATLNHSIRAGTTRYGSDVMVQYGGRQFYICSLGFIGKILKTYTCRLDVYL